MFDTKKVADTYDQIALNFSATRGKLSPEVISLIPRLAEMAKVLDLGCGNGVLLTAFPTGSVPVSYTGIDISPALVEEAKRRHPEREFLVADLTADSTWRQLGQFDFIAALAVFHHLPGTDDHIKLLRNIKQHLKPTGVCLISIWRLDQPRFDKFRTDPKHHSIPFHGGAKRDFYAFADDELAKLAKKVGFSAVKIKIVKDNLYLTLNP